MVEFSDTTYTSMVDLWTDTHVGLNVEKMVKSNSFIIGTYYDEPQKAVKISYTIAGSTIEESVDFTAYVGGTYTTRFEDITAVEATNYVLIACSRNNVAELDHYKPRRIDSLAFSNPPDLIERASMTRLLHMAPKPTTNFVLMTYVGLEVIDYTDLTVSTI